MGNTIKFRAMCQATNVWVYGLPKTCTSLSNEITHIEQFYGEERKFGRSNVFVKPETLCQFTGLKDNNGEEFYNGSIFFYQKHSKYLLDSFVGEIVWIKEYACFGYNKRGANKLCLATPFTDHDELLSDFLSHCKIIGNIFENDNLLED